MTDWVEDTHTTGLFNGKPSVVANVSRQPGANIIATVDAVRARLPVLRAALPADVKLEVASDRTNSIRASLHEVEATLLIATLLVVRWSASSSAAGGRRSFPRSRWWYRLRARWA